MVAAAGEKESTHLSAFIASFVVLHACARSLCSCPRKMTGVPLRVTPAPTSSRNLRPVLHALWL